MKKLVFTLAALAVILTGCSKDKGGGGGNRSNQYGYDDYYSDAECYDTGYTRSSSYSYYDFDSRGRCIDIRSGRPAPNARSCDNARGYNRNTSRYNDPRNRGRYNDPRNRNTSRYNDPRLRNNDPRYRNTGYRDLPGNNRDCGFDRNFGGIDPIRYSGGIDPYICERFDRPELGLYTVPIYYPGTNSVKCVEYQTFSTFITPFGSPLAMPGYQNVYMGCGGGFGNCSCNTLQGRLGPLYAGISAGVCF